MRALSFAVLLLSLPAFAAEAPRTQKPKRIDICSPLIVSKKRQPDAIELHERKALPMTEVLQPPETFLKR